MTIDNLFNPQFYSREKLSLMFTARENKLNTLLNEINKNTEEPKNRLIIAPWGGGKTHFLLMVFHQICYQEGPVSQWYPVFISGRDSYLSTFGNFLARLMEQIFHLPDSRYICLQRLEG